ncbi:7tm 1 domain containing protein [Trichuris trichiura]|uniref:7tm 1 domain containing protein n=1 Tax=Trichuris trichiura TaxID=36087 RepID=A0A077Z6D7_TRITR|nr:7tm 1 domain containing protein [Trichuris trichiura]
MDEHMVNESIAAQEVGLHELGTVELVIWFVLYALIAFLSITGNTLVIYVFFASTRLQTVTNLLIVNLAVADLMTGMLAIPFKFQAALLQRWFLPAVMCSVVPFIETVSLSVSVFTLILSSVDRFRAVVTASRSNMRKRAIRLWVLLIWTISIACSVPYGVDHMVYEFDDPTTNSTVPMCLPKHSEETWWKAYNVYLTIIQYFVPLVIIDFIYCIIAYNVWLTPPIRSQYDRKFERSKRTVIKMLVMIVVAFTFCWLPYEIYLVLNEVWPQVNEYYYINVIFFCAHWLAMSNSCLNPIIYGLYNKKFQREYLRVFYKCFRRSAKLKRESEMDSQPSERRAQWDRTSRCHFYIFNELGKVEGQ